MQTDLCAMEDLQTVVLGASPNPSRYAHMAVLRLLARGIPVTAVGQRAGTIGGITIVPEIPLGTAPHTVTLYMNPLVQEAWHERILKLAPKRIIFNPGTEHEAFMQQARQAGIEVVEGCTLVMLGTGQY